MSETKKIWLIIGVMVLISPIGLILPEVAKAGAAWGEWGSVEIKELVGYVPNGLEKLASIWNPPLPDYAFRGWEEKGIGFLSVSYIVSAVIGVMLIAGVMYIIGKITIGKR